MDKLNRIGLFLLGSFLTFMGASGMFRAYFLMEAGKRYPEGMWEGGTIALFVGAAAIWISIRRET
ncbi:MAG: hypothetical protein KBC16_00730 [Candidatus Pacebacteria bacterium]|nr:hypothetical protein [Candidatus Paceibacterota bacterium]